MNTLEKHEFISFTIYELLEWFDIFDTILRPDLKQAWKQHYLEDLHPSKVWYESEAIKDLKEAGFRDIKTKQVWGLERLIVARR